ncbi:hypothetical protein HU735_22780 [Pseudomonas sp. BW16M2]|uniref:hypothetical protein n=1 Tax=unclassified Pseudomonas TaxID=196821 RepID=UPI0016495B13|nr:hypothetical protein [Pseudomonas sp. DVZ24]MBC3438250.1 hypothetical protein [Pseudomonas sp. BW16M2]MCP8636640.1 hypothetical protein [Pseudomonas sp. DVZ6]MDC0689357.1 hypothetical protein [Mitsuaria sp. RG]MDD7787399.1 hypothetical protein [Pseudomonas sp. DVZ24]
MSEITYAVIALVLYGLLDRFLRPYSLRKWLGVALAVVGVVGCIVVSQARSFGLDLGLLSVLATGVGVGLFVRRRRFEQVG